MSLKKKLTDLHKILGSIPTSKYIDKIGDVILNINDKITNDNLDLIFLILCDMVGRSISEIEDGNKFIQLLNNFSEKYLFKTDDIISLIEYLQNIRFDCEMTFLKHYHKKGIQLNKRRECKCLIMSVDSKNYDKLKSIELKQTEFDVICDSLNFATYVNNNPNFLNEVLLQSPNIQFTYQNIQQIIKTNGHIDNHKLFPLIPLIYKHNNVKSHEFICSVIHAIMYSRDDYIESEHTINNSLLIIDEFVKNGLSMNQLGQISTLICNRYQQLTSKLFTKYNLKMSEDDTLSIFINMINQHINGLGSYLDPDKYTITKKTDRFILNMMAKLSDISMKDYLSARQFDITDLDFGLLNACISKKYDLICYFLDKKIIPTKKHFYAFLMENYMPTRFDPHEILVALISYGFNYDHECCELIVNRFGWKSLDKLYNSKKLSLSENDYEQMKQTINPSFYKPNKLTYVERYPYQTKKSDDPQQILQKNCLRCTTGNILDYMMCYNLTLDKMCCENIITSNSAEVFYYFYDDIMKILTNISIDLILQINDYVKRKIFIKLFYPNIYANQNESTIESNNDIVQKNNTSHINISKIKTKSIKKLIK